MRILFFGDVYGEVGKRCLLKHLPLLISKYNSDCVIANAENITYGSGISLNDYKDLISGGVDIVTAGNHFFSANIKPQSISSMSNLVRPLNLIYSTSGTGSKKFNIRGKEIKVTCLLGKVYMKDFDQTDLYPAIDKVLEDCVHIVEIHAEATAEKQAIGHYLDGKVSAVIGTHTHVQTADERILSNGTAFITDCGMNGPKDSIIGSTVKSVIERDSGKARKLEVASGNGQINAVFIETDDNNKALKIERINFSEE